MVLLSSGFLVATPALIVTLARFESAWGMFKLNTVSKSRLATERNPSPRTYFYMIGLVTNLILYVLLFISLI